MTIEDRLPHGWWIAPAIIIGTALWGLIIWVIV